MALTSLAYVVRMTRSSTVDVLQTDYVRTANLKGLPPRRVLFTHVLRNSLLPDRHRGGDRHRLADRRPDRHRVACTPTPGIGRLLLFAIQQRDLVLIQATALLIVIIYVVANLVADILYAVLNPRIRYT